MSGSDSNNWLATAHSASQFLHKTILSFKIGADNVGSLSDSLFSRCIAKLIAASSGV